MITLWRGGSSPQCYHSHAGTDCTTHTFTAYDSQNDLKVGFKLSENWEKAHIRVVIECWKNRRFTELDQDCTKLMCSSLVVRTVCVMNNWVMYWLSSWFFLVFAESQLNAPQRQLEVMPVADSTPVATLARSLAFHSQFYELWNCELLKWLWLSDRSSVICYRDPYHIII